MVRRERQISWTEVRGEFQILRVHYSSQYSDEGGLENIYTPETSKNKEQ